MAHLAILQAAGFMESAAMGRLVWALNERAWHAALITLLFALLAFRMRAVDAGGATAGGLISFTLYVSGGPGAFLVLAVVFALTAATTRLRYAHKRRLGVAERRKGRTAWQIAANLAVAAALSVAALVRCHEVLLFAAVAALAEAAADTVSSECGQAFARRVYMITSFERRRIGTDGAISVVGTIAGAAAALIIAITGARTGLILEAWVPAATGAAILGNCFDSLLGATLQQRGWLNNSAVNLLATLLTAGIAVVLALQGGL
jgi:uncharacterized protein (TIGR00297 family)